MDTFLKSVENFLNDNRGKRVKIVGGGLSKAELIRIKSVEDNFFIGVVDQGADEFFIPFSSILMFRNCFKHHRKKGFISKFFKIDQVPIVSLGRTTQFEVS